MTTEIFDYVIVGSGFGGSVSAMRLTEKGYKVLVLERGKRYRDEDFATTNWLAWKYIWLPVARCFGILQISFFRDVFVLHGSGVGGGSLGYANVLTEPNDDTFDEPAWRKLADWKTLLRPHYLTARRMLGVTPNPKLWASDLILRDIADKLGQGASFRPTPVGTFFGQPGQEGQTVPDPYFGGEGPDRTACIHCGACMVGCRHNAKNTLVKNYLYFAEKWGAVVRPEAQVHDIRPLPAGQPDGARYEVVYHQSTAWFAKPEKVVRARQVIISAGALGTLRLLFRCRDITQSLSKLSDRLGSLVRTNSESLLGVTARDGKSDYSKGIAITSIFNADKVTTVEPVRYPEGSDLMRFLAGPLIEKGSFWQRLTASVFDLLKRPTDFFRTHILPGWARRSTILLIMQTEDNYLKLRLGRSVFTLWHKDLVSQPDDEEHRIPTKIEIGHEVTRQFSSKMDGIPAGTFNESLFNIPMTAHILGGCPLGQDASEGVVDASFQIHNYPGLYAIDGSIIPANTGVNPSLTITAMAEYAMSLIPPKDGKPLRAKPLGIVESAPVPGNGNGHGPNGKEKEPEKVAVAVK